MKTFPQTCAHRCLPVALFATLAAALLIPGARGQGDDTGPGTIDPATIASHEVVRDGGLVDDPHETLTARFLASDGVGNLYVAATLSRSDTVFRVPRSVISKYSPEGVLIWRRERQVDYRTTFGLETFSPDQTPVNIVGPDAVAVAEVSALRVDFEGNVTVGFNTVIVRRDDRTGKDQLFTGPRTLVVRFDRDGRYQWRSTFGLETLGAKGLPYYRDQEFTGIAALELKPDGGVAVALANHSKSSTGSLESEATVLVSLGADGSRQFSATFGTPDDRTNATPTALAPDGSGAIFLLTTELPDNGSVNPNSTLDTVNVIRKFDPAGNLVARARTPYADPGNGNATEARVDARADAAGNLYVAASIFRDRPGRFSTDGVTGQLVLAFHPDLSPRWRTLGPPPTQTAEDQPHADARFLRLSPGGVTVGGETRSPAVQSSRSDEHWEILRLSAADGVIQWHRLFQAPAVPNVSRGDSLGNLEVDAEGSVYAFGTRSAAPRNELVFIKYSAAGDTQFIKPLPAAAQTFDVYPDGFQLAGDNHPTFLSASEDAKQVVALRIDNPGLAPATGAGHPGFFNGETALGSGVYFLRFANKNPFGFYSYLADAHYIYHFDLGYEYVFDAQDGRGGVFLYDFKSGGFFYTSPNFPFPYLYDFSLKAVLYYFPDPNGDEGRFNTNGIRYFARLDTGEIISK